MMFCTGNSEVSKLGIQSLKLSVAQHVGEYGRGLLFTCQHWHGLIPTRGQNEKIMMTKHFRSRLIGISQNLVQNDIKVEGSTAGDEGLPSMKFCRHLSKRDAVTLFRMSCSGCYKTQKEFSAISCPKAVRADFTSVLLDAT